MLNISSTILLDRRISLSISTSEMISPEIASTNSLVTTNWIESFFSAVSSAFFSTSPCIISPALDRSLPVKTELEGIDTQPLKETWLRWTHPLPSAHTHFPVSRQIEPYPQSPESGKVGSAIHISPALPPWTGSTGLQHSVGWRYVWKSSPQYKFSIFTSILCITFSFDGSCLIGCPLLLSSRSPTQPTTYHELQVWRQFLQPAWCAFRNFLPWWKCEKLFYQFLKIVNDFWVKIINRFHLWVAVGVRPPLSIDLSKCGAVSKVLRKSNMSPLRLVTLLQLILKEFELYEINSDLRIKASDTKPAGTVSGFSFTRALEIMLW